MSDKCPIKFKEKTEESKVRKTTDNQRGLASDGGHSAVRTAKTENRENSVTLPRKCSLQKINTAMYQTENKRIINPEIKILWIAKPWGREGVTAQVTNLRQGRNKK
jgi:virulence-associated protein VagC